MAKLQSLVEKFKEKEQEQENLKAELGTVNRKPGRPRKGSSGNEKTRLNFLLDQSFAEDLKALATIKKTSLTSLFVGALSKEIEEHRRDIDILKSMQK